MITTPTERMNGLAATAGNDRTATVSATRPTALRSVDPRRDRSPTGVGSVADTDVVSEALGKTTSEESLRPHHQGGEQRDVEERLGPGGPERDLQQGRAHAEHHGGDGCTGDAAEAADDDDRHPLHEDAHAEEQRHGDHE